MKNLLYLIILSIVFVGCKTSKKSISVPFNVYENGNYDTPAPEPDLEHQTPKPSPREGTCTSLDNIEPIYATSYINYYPVSADYVKPIKTSLEYLGVRYRGGGTSKAGMDCSGLVYTSFKAHDITLPRSSIDMANVGFKIDKNQAKPGDLIFFRTNGRRRINHVGIVTEVFNDEIRFIHSSIQRGVIISSTKEAYYSRAFAQINRILKE